VDAAVSSNWLAVVGTVVGASVAVVVYAFEKFQTKDEAKVITDTLKDEAKEARAFMVERLDRFEDKLDAAIQRR
jgi:hypothetical protein